MTYSILTTTVSTDEEADMLARTILHAGLAACVQVEDILSYYNWEGELHEDPEKRLTIKTRSALVPQLTEAIVKAHPYKVPQILETSVASGLPAYLKWVDESTQPKAGK